VRERVETILREREAEKRWLDTDEAATYLGVTASGIRKMVQRGELPYSRLNRRLLIDRRALDAQLEVRSR
jgi:excisionase family DNA binding protein